ncbi:MAG: Hsp20/alpha crystallin family protein [Betaproteobacteria bacterium]|nr:Hsp20/alpha crystallin family protein [Betaproteobacteria bacterium]
MNQLTRYDPFGDEGFDDLFRGFFKPVRLANAPAAIAIKMDVTETDKGYAVHAEIPGVKKEDIHVAIEGNQVTVSAEVKREAEKKEGDRVLRSERYFGSVYRSFTLPVEIDEAASTARYDNGILQLTLARKAPVAGRKLTVQ